MGKIPDVSDLLCPSAVSSLFSTWFAFGLASFLWFHLRKISGKGLTGGWLVNSLLIAAVFMVSRYFSKIVARLTDSTFTGCIFHCYHAIGHLQCHRHNHRRGKPAKPTRCSPVFIFYLITVSQGLLLAPLPMLRSFRTRVCWCDV